MSLNKYNYTPVSQSAKNKSLLFISVVFSIFVVLTLTSCEFWHQPVRDYFEKWTQEVSIQKFEIEGVETYYDIEGNLCVGSEQAVPVKLYMINPRHETLSFSSGDGLFTQEGLGTFPVITQDGEDSTILHFTYSAEDFLRQHDAGEEIGATITVHHPYNHTTKDFTFNLKCNSRPPLIEDAAIMTTADSDGNQTYVIAFRYPPADQLNGIHRDIEYISIDDATYPVTVSGGNMSFSDPHFETTRPNPLSVKNRQFEHSDRAVYYLTGEPIIEGVKVYTIGYTDNKGLASSITFDTALPRLKVPVVKNNDGTALSYGETMNILHIDEEQIYSTVTIEIPVKDEAENAVDDATVKWKLTELPGMTQVAQGVKKYSETSGPTLGKISQEIPHQGQYILKVWAEKQGYTSSVPVEYKLNLVYATLKAPVVSDVGDNLLSPLAANNYLDKDSGQEYASVKLIVPTTTTANANVSGVTMHYTINRGTTKNSEATDHPVNSNQSLTSTTFGQWCLTVKATKDGYNDSDEERYLIKVYSKDIYVKSDGNNDTGDGSSEKPFATILKAVSEFASYGNTNAEYTIHVVGKLVGSQYIQMSFDGKASKLTLIGEPDGTNSGILDGNQEGPALWEQTSVPVVITNLKITNGKYTNGGGIYFSGADLTLENGTEISENEATTDSTSGGGGVYATGKLTVKSGCTIKNNKADSGYGGGIYMSSGNKTVTIETGATLEGNTAEAGGAISIDTGTLELSGGTLKSNYATEKGGAIYNNATLNINSGTLSENKASGSGGNGGGIYCYNGSCLIKGGSIKNNYAVYDGGAVYIGYNSSVTLDGGTIGGASSSDKNSSGNNGGGVYVLNGTFTLKSGTIAYNEAVKAGAGIYNYKTCNIEGGSIENNTLTGSETLQGGGIYNIANCTMTDGTIKNNSAGTGFGGGVFTSNGNSGTFTMSGGTVDSNTATTGSGIYVNSYFYMSKSAKVTSGIYLYTGNKIIINDDLDNSNAATITLEGAKRKNQVLDGSKVAANYSKITYSGSKYIIDNAGCLRLKNSVKIKYNMGINDDKASPGSFKLKNKTDGALTNSFTIISGYTDTVTDDANFTSNPLKDPATGYIDKIDVARSFYRWTYQKNGSAVTIDSSVNTYPDELADYVDSTNTIELTGSWMPASGDRIKEIWSSIVYDYDYYLNHSTFNVYTADQVTQIFSATEQNSLGSLGSSVPFTGKTIVFQEDINMGYLHTSKHNDNGTNTYISFEGHLDGNGKKLGAFIESNGTKVGLVGELAGGTIEGLTLQNRVVYNDGGTPLNVEISVGGIVGYITNDGGTIKNCTVDAAIGSNASMDCVGGIVGNIMATTNAFKVTITGCTKNGTVNGKQFVGGIVGSGSNGCTIKGNTMNAMVKHDGTSGNVGKIIGAGNLSSPNINTIGSSGSLGSHNSSVTENNTGY